MNKNGNIAKIPLKMADLIIFLPTKKMQINIWVNVMWKLITVLLACNLYSIKEKQFMNATSPTCLI